MLAKDNSKTKIAYILPGLKSGGAESFICNVIENLDRNKYEISIILSSNNEKDFFEERVLTCGIKIYKTINLKGFKSRINHLKMVYKILKKTGPYDIVHSNLDLFNGVELAVAKKARIPIRVSHSHACNSESENNPIKKPLFGLYRFFMNSIIWKNSTVQIGCSHLAMDFLYRNKWNNSKTSKIVINGISIDKFKYTNIDLNSYSQKLNIDMKKYNLLTVGRLVYQKNPLFIVEIVNELSKIRNDFVLNWVGDGPLKEKIYNKINELNLNKYINFLGVRKDIPEIMKCCNSFLFPSISEGLGIVLIEAQASGLDCFISDTIPTMANCGKCMILPLSEEAKLWANKINDYIDTNKKMSLDNCKLNKFDIKYTISELEKFYQ